jgi:hypothetical protein
LSVRVFDWLKRKAAPARPERTLFPALAAAPEGNAGEYHALYVYLRDRYANRLVLTFAEIEDLLGFRLPERARVQPLWWSQAVAVGLRSTETSAWALAGRRATANLAAQIVVFERGD